MARKPNQAHRRSAIIDAAARAVVRRGSAETKLKDVAEEASLTSASILYYYRDKQELLSDTYTRGKGSYIRRRLELIEQAGTAWEKLETCVASGVPTRGEEEMTTSLLLCELLPLTFRDAKAASAHAEFNLEQVTLYASILRDGAASGEFTLAAPAELLARTLLALEDGYVFEILSGNIEPDEVRQHILTIARLATGLS